MMSNVRRFLVMTGFWVAAWAAPAAAASPAEPPDLPLGPAFFTHIERPREAGRPACSFRRAVCVHGDRVSPAIALGTLADLELAASRLTDGAGLPSPLADGSRGGTPAFDIYLVGAGEPALAGASEVAARDEPAPGWNDSASAFGLVRRDLPAGCLRQNLVARAFASAILY